MKSLNTYALAWCLFLLPMFTISGELALAQKNPDDLLVTPAGKERVCVSLRVFSAKVREALSNGSELSQEVDTLAGIEYPEGLIEIQEGARDIVIFGLRSAGRSRLKRPVLHLQDLIGNYSAISRNPVVLARNPAVCRFSDAESVSVCYGMSSSDPNSPLVARSVAHFPGFEHTTPVAPRSKAILIGCLHLNTAR